MQSVIILGASNVTLSFPLLVHSLRTNLDAPWHLFAAHGHGRSFGTWSRVLGRGLPSIDACGLWDAWESGRSSHDAAPLALVTDVGNDLLYGVEPETISGWVGSCLRRLQQQSANIVLTRIPRASVMKMSAARYHATRLCFFPRHDAVSWPEMKRRIRELDDRMVELGTSLDCRVVDPRAEWYGFDPIHVRQSRRRPAWEEILSGWSPESDWRMRSGRWRESVTYWRLKPFKWRRFGRSCQQQQPTLVLRGGSQVSLF